MQLDTGNWIEQSVDPYHDVEDADESIPRVPVAKSPKAVTMERGTPPRSRREVKRPERINPSFKGQSYVQKSMYKGWKKDAQRAYCHLQTQLHPRETYTIDLAICMVNVIAKLKTICPDVQSQIRIEEVW